MRDHRSILLTAVVTATVGLLPAMPEALTVGFYKYSCPNAETIVQQAVATAFAKDQGIAAGLIRMHFHDCFVRGCDASVLLDGNTTEKSAIPNQTLRGFEVIDAAKTALEAACPNIVSCSDIITFAARDSAALSGNITWKVPSGRRDGTVSLNTDALANLPSPFSTAQQLVDGFANKNLTADEMVTLSGAHSIGVAHCFAFTNRLYNFSKASDIDPTLSFAYASLLRKLCPAGSGPGGNVTAFLDIVSPNVLDNRYYIAVMNNLGLLTSDQALVTNSTLLTSVKNNADNANGWANRFMNAMVKMGSIQVLEGTNGEIRKNCRVVNPKKSTVESGLRGYGSMWTSQ